MISPDLDLRLDALRTKEGIVGATLDAFKAFLGSASDEALFRMSPLRSRSGSGRTSPDSG